MTRIAIIGAGFGGVAVAASLLKAGFRDIVVLEKAASAGGVWRDNTYPGCACDVPAPLYSYSFALNPSWSRRYPPHDEILAYLRSCADKTGVTPLIRYGAEVASAVWSSGAWDISLTGGEEVRADVLIPAVGQLSRPSIPALPGAESFTGIAVHTAHWTPGIPVDGRRIAVVGTGASAIQLVPAIAGRATHIDVYQRTAPWTVPKPDRRYGRLRQALARRLPALMLLSRAATWGLTLVPGAALHGNRPVNALIRAYSWVQRHWQVRDPVLRAKVTPDEPIGCKRLLFTNAWLPTLNRPDVDLITEKIIAVTPDGIRTADGTDHPCDVLVYGTGFAATDFLAPIEITGRDGVSLAGAWSGGAHAYLGLAVPGFPNMFLVYGPNTNTGNTSVIYFHEAQARWITQAVRSVAQGTTMEVRPEVAAAYDTEIQSRLSTSVWSACQSWYRTAAGRIVTNWPGSATEYRRRTAVLDRADFRPAVVRDDSGGAG
ncbi:flavin-containing monooxygenase [Actinoplanes derwentensis]|uniref:Predicted flavoprotein CzcO associated with the cation diffusion facilitator CzcD n=1 Tax=Actinoplanes derwentensis TaxID=113562 RepID=A0A1H2DFD8_9ACTN|nr:NAD(P)/FAD-dependent oxidoreductase [Actinoplanes derwentensis]GID84736.1 4-hydroxyacetophenone monooxygenase [Actinoplanes derwentensis]SDT81212.1 Predicted flavoprotein CzcO associated with the cation diffusion facilitator CzcD [Actinoplanes derwentensis]